MIFFPIKLGLCSPVYTVSSNTLDFVGPTWCISQSSQQLNIQEVYDANLCFVKIFKNLKMYHSYTGSPLLCMGLLSLRRREPLSGQCVGSSQPRRLSLWSMGPRHAGFSNRGSLVWLPRGTCNLPGPGIKLVSPVLAASLGSPEKSTSSCFQRGVHVRQLTRVVKICCSHF